ncbi:Rv2175c family DNA-binding protein [Rothia sp. LK2588]|uniref:Rv2175c family DNA-binding protein n=1 Tax=Rothia sp. LK2588 TaxID=3114369 RepID=UPI0034CDD703
MNAQNSVSNDPHTVEAFQLVDEWLTIPDVAESFDLKVTRVHNLISERALLALRHPETQVRMIPALFVREDHPLEPLKGTLNVLADAGFSDAEAIVWLYTDDETLPGCPIDALIDGRKTEIRRRAQALAW